MSKAPPWEKKLNKGEISPSRAMVVDLRRCIGCHACSVACKMEHEVPLGEFRMRVRWLQNQGDSQIDFLPVFDTNACDMGAKRSGLGLPPSCVSACPTKALIFGEEEALKSAHPQAKALEHEAVHKKALYIDAKEWHLTKLNKGAALSPDDEDIIYEQ